MIGNRAFGERIQAFADSRLIPAAYACVLLSPQIPMRGWRLSMFRISVVPLREEPTMKMGASTLIDVTSGYGLG